MKRKIKMLLYGEPGVGKSVFANKADKRFFITTDGNYEWLADFGAKSDDHKQVSSWKEFVEFINDDKNFEGYDTIVIDLLEDLFRWNEAEFVKKNKLEHIGDMGYGKGYGITRDEFFIEISKLIAKPKHIIAITHETTEVVKDRRGVETTIYKPHRDIPEVVLAKIEGRMRFVVRAYMQDVEKDGTFELKRFLSVTPKPNEYGILRGIKDTHLQEDIPLDWSSFVELITTYRMTQQDVDQKVKEETKVEPTKKVVDIEKVEKIQEEKKEEETKVQDKKAEMLARMAALKKEQESEEVVEEEVVEEVVEETIPEPKVEEKPKVVKPKPEVKKVEPKVVETKKEESSKDNKILVIRAKLKATKFGAEGKEVDKVATYIVENNPTDEEIEEFVNKLK